MICNKECGYRTPHGYCGVTTCCNLVITTAQPSHFSEEKKMSEYKPPINVTFEDISNEVINRYDDAIICIAKKITGIDVDKERLTNALLLDKNLVRCKDCKYKVVTEDGEWNPEDIVCDYWASDGLEADDFCSRGEKKNEDSCRDE